MQKVWILVFFSVIFINLSLLGFALPTEPVLTDPGDENATNGHFLVDWTDAQDPAGIEVYEFQESTDTLFANPTLWYPPASQSEYQFYNHANGTYYYRVRAKNNIGEWGSWSQNAVDMVINRDVTLPTIPVLTDPGDIDYDLSYLLEWTPSQDISGIEVYELQEDIESGFSNPAYFYFSASTSDYFFANKAEGTYYYRIRAKDNSGNWSLWSGVVDITTLLDLTPPSTPVLSASSNNVFEENFVLSWTASEDVSGIETYEFQEDTDPSFSQALITYYSSAQLSHQVEGKAEGSYYYRVRAKDNADYWSDWSNTETVTVIYPVISNVQITEVTDSSARVSWTSDLAVPSKLKRYGVIKNHANPASNDWSDPNYRFQGINYAPAEAHCLFDDDCNEAAIDRDLQAFKDHNINLINLYNIGWSEIAHLEEYIFQQCQALGIKINIRLEAYDKTTFNWDENDADWIVSYYSQVIQYANAYPDAVAYYMLNMPFDDFELRDDYYGGYPTTHQQRIYVAALRDEIRELDPNPDHKFFVNVGYGGGDLDPHGFISDLVDGISVHVYSTTYFPFPFCYDYPPTENDPEYLAYNKDVFDYFLDKNYVEHRIEEYGIPMIIDQTGYADITDFGAGKVATREAKQRAIELLTEYIEKNQKVARGWSYFKAFDKFGVGGENASWGIVDTLEDEDLTPKTNHSIVLTELFHDVNYAITIIAGAKESDPYTFQTLLHPAEDNQRPSITIINPKYGNEIAQNGQFIIRWEDEDPDDNATISLYYDLYDKAPLQGETNRLELSKYQGTLIVAGIQEDDTSDSFVWDVSGIDPGAYMIYAAIEDNHEPEIDYSSGRVITGNKQIQATYHPNASQIIVDGSIQEDIWNHAEWVDLGTSTNPDESSARIKFVWDEDFLYVAFEVFDTMLETSLPNTPWNHDNISLTLFNGTVDNFTPLGMIPKARIRVDGVFEAPSIVHRLNQHEAAIEYIDGSTVDNNSDTDVGYRGEMKFFM
ncbi:MAG: sugar-binding protein, partial [Chlamydiota bacterium]|nr:sugar-binding protein [Chlamydiota bacterium]